MSECKELIVEYDEAVKIINRVQGKRFRLSVRMHAPAKDDPENAYYPVMACVPVSKRELLKALSDMYSEPMRAKALVMIQEYSNLIFVG